jgi:hypothetical protein
MQTILIQTKSKGTQKLLIELAKKLGNRVSILDDTIAEDLAFGAMMKEAKTGKNVSKLDIVAHLNH